MVKKAPEVEMSALNLYMECALVSHVLHPLGPLLHDCKSTASVHLQGHPYKDNR